MSTQIPEYLAKGGPNPRLQTDTFTVIQEEMALWSPYNFPDDQGHPERKVLGIMEEIGEISTAAQNIHSVLTDPKRHIAAVLPSHDRLPKAMELMKDALGDVMVYLADLLRMLEIDYVEVCQKGQADLAEDRTLANNPQYSSTPDDNLLLVVGYYMLHLTESGGKICHHTLKNLQGIRGSEEVHMRRLKRECVDLYGYLATVAHFFQFNLQECAAAAWEGVRLRDWVKKRAEASEAKHSFVCEQEVHHVDSDYPVIPVVNDSGDSE